MKQEIQQLADSQNATIDFDLTINEELYIRTRIERTATRVKSYVLYCLLLNLVRGKFQLSEIFIKGIAVHFEFLRHSAFRHTCL